MAATTAKKGGLSEAEAERQIRQMVNFIKQEAEEKAAEIRTKVRPPASAPRARPPLARRPSWARCPRRPAPRPRASATRLRRPVPRTATVMGYAGRHVPARPPVGGLRGIGRRRGGAGDARADGAARTPTGTASRAPRRCFRWTAVWVEGE